MRPDHIVHIFTKVTLFVIVFNLPLPLPCLSSFFDYLSLRLAIFTWNRYWGEGGGRWLCAAVQKSWGFLV